MLPIFKLSIIIDIVSPFPYKCLLRLYQFHAVKENIYLCDLCMVFFFFAILLCAFMCSSVSPHIALLMVRKIISKLIHKNTLYQTIPSRADPLQILRNER